jgi:hypothetical protein
MLSPLAISGLLAGVTAALCWGGGTDLAGQGLSDFCH